MIHGGHHFPISTNYHIHMITNFPQKGMEAAPSFGFTCASGPGEWRVRQNCTWDLQQSLTRRNSNTPRSMQLDFIFLQNQRDGDFPEPDKGLSTRLLDEIDSDIEANCSRTLEMKVLSTAVVDPEKFLTAPLSDHYGLLSQVELAWHM